MSDNIIKKLDRYSENTDTCFGNENNGFFEDFFGRFQDSFCYIFVLQFLVVTLMYFNVGKGKYWRLLFYAALAGFLGAMLENSSVAYICRSSVKDVEYKYVYTFLIDEIFWIPNEYAIPLLNLIKMKAFSEGKVGAITKYTILFLSLPFVFFRLCIGYLRMSRGYLQDTKIHAYHGYAFAVMAVADTICSVVLLYFIKKNNQKINNNGASINKFVKNSSYTILITVDIVSALLSVINIITNIDLFKNSFPSKLFTPFHCLKCSSILILAVDAFIFKYGANVSSNNGSSEYRNYANSKGNNTYGGNYSSNMSTSYKSKLPNINSDMNKSKSNNNSVINMSSYNYTPTESTYTNNMIISNSKSISYSLDNNNESYERTFYSNQSYGFMNQY